ncbi:hypothetical protein SADUNF_Sadunf08G0074400 [Salix dunnii]|uniref:Uncharacterized protein n=1 Tax=Salix dunnii TaxID=1413687 RepID=A0A835JTF6_9ROSI|nr:hypothetical protein SADUNF_Sadunf08G0074400 [Salix dunnii]
MVNEFASWKVEAEVIRQHEAKRGSSAKSEKATSVIQLREDVQKAIENENYEWQLGYEIDFKTGSKQTSIVACQLFPDVPVVADLHGGRIAIIYFHSCTLLGYVPAYTPQGRILNRLVAFTFALLA